MTKFFLYVISRRSLERITELAFPWKVYGEKSSTATLLYMAEADREISAAWQLFHFQFMGARIH